MSRPFINKPFNKWSKPDFLSQISWLAKEYRVPTQNVKRWNKNQLIQEFKRLEANENRNSVLEKRLKRKEKKSSREDYGLVGTVISPITMELRKDDLIDLLARYKTNLTNHNQTNSRVYTINTNLEYNNEKEKLRFRNYIRPTVMVHSRNDHIHILINYSFEAIHGRNEASKDFNGYLVSQLNNLMNDIENWRDNLFPGGRTYEINIESVVITITRANAGGCRSGYDKVEKIKDFKIQNYRAQHNNCFFRTIKEELGWELISRANCNRVRMEFKIEDDEPITIEQGIAIFKKYCKGKHLSILDNSLMSIHTNTNNYDERIKYKQLMLIDGHYVVIDSNITQPMICPLCKVKYVKQHNCFMQKYPKCKECLHHHNTEKECNSSKLSYVKTKIFKSKQKYLLSNFQPEELDNDSVVHFDIETHSKNKNNTHTPYIVGYTDKGCKYNFIAGDDCMEQFVDLMLKKYEKGDKKIYLNAFNGANFDNYQFVRIALKKGREPDKFILQNGGIVRASYGNLVLIDVSKHTTGSLKNNLKNFKCKTLKGDFDHSKGNYWSKMSIKDRIDCIKYLESDVMGLKEFYDKLNTAVNKRHNLNLHKYFSVSQMTFAKFAYDATKRQNLLISLPTKSQERVFRSGCYGARCYPSRSFFISENDEDYLFDMDVVSLYPTAMERFEYPVGDPFEIDEKTMKKFNENMQSKKKCLHLGYYYIKYKPNKYLAHAVLPNKTKTGLEWTLKDGEGYYSSVDIDSALMEDYEIKIVKPTNGDIGYYWTKSAYVFKDYITDLYNDKNPKDKGTAKYEIAKLFMNGLYGKMIQQPIFDKTIWIKSNAEFWKFYSKNIVKSMKFIEDKIYICGYSRNEEEIEKCLTKPTYLGGLILSYSRVIMLDYMKQSNPYFNIKQRVLEGGNLEELVSLQMKNDIYYTDTDSLHVHNTNVLEFNKNKLGCLANDLDDGVFIKKAIYISPKLYSLEKSDGSSHLRGKGIDNKKLTTAIFDKMREGKAITLERDFQMKKIHVNKNSKQENIDNFSILHITGSKTARTINTKKWSGRQWIGNESLPFGHQGINIFD